MLDIYPDETKANFVRAFVREVILNTSSANFFFLEELISRKEFENSITKGINSEKIEKLDKEEIKEIVKDYYEKSPRERVKEYFRETGDKINFGIDFNRYDEKGKEVVHLDLPQKRASIPFAKKPREIRSRQILRIPEGHLPPRFRNLRPVKSNQRINLGKLDALINDSNVKMIECLGSGQSIFVNGAMGRKPTNILLSDQEINEVIENFSRSSRIPVEEGLFKVAFGGLVLTATVSSSGSSFIIKKI